MPLPAVGTKFGAYLDTSALGTTLWVDAVTEWQAITGITLSAGHWFAGTNYTVGTTLNAMIAAGVRICLDLAPPYNPVSSTDRTSIASMLASLQAAGADVQVSLWHEPFFGGLTAAQYTAMIAYYGPTVRQYYPLWAVFSGNDTNEANGYFPGDGTVDGIAVDQYGISTTWLTQGAAMADAHGLPLGLWEFNAAFDFGIDPSPVTGNTFAQGLTFLTYVKNFFVNRLNGGKPNGDILVFSATGTTTGTKNFLGHSRSQNGGFEGGIGTWVAGANNTVGPSSAQAHSGSGSLVATCTTAGTIAAAHCLAANITTQGMPITAGQTAAASCWLRPGSTARNVRPGLFFYNSAGTFLSNSFATAVAEASGAWKFFSHTAVAPANAAYVKMQVELDTVALSEVHYLDDPQMGVLPATTDHTAPIQYPWDYRIAPLAAIADVLDGTISGGWPTSPYYPPPSAGGPSSPVPLAVRLQTSRADRHITRDLASLRFRDTAPGGYASLSLQLQRPLLTGAPELAHYGRVFVYDGRTGETVWEGYQDAPIVSAGDEGLVTTVTATGPSARARDRKVPLVYTDNDLSRWQRDGIAAGEVQNAQESGASTFNQLRVPRGVNAVTNTCIVDTVYRLISEAGQKVARVEFRWDAGITDAGWQIRMFVGATVAYSTTANTAGSGGSAIPVVVITDFPNDGTNTTATARWQRIGVTGPVGDDDTWVRFGTPLRLCAMRMTASGTEKTTGYTTTNVLSSEVVADLLGRLLTTYDGAGARVDTTSYAIDQLVYPDGTTAGDVLDDLMVLDPAYYWAVWESAGPFAGKSRFEWRVWPSSIRYQATADDGFEPSSASAELFDRVRVRYVDSVRRTRSVLRTQTVDVLTAAGITREGFVDLGSEAGSSGNATQAGDGFLADHAVIPNAGTLTVARPVLDLQTGRMVPPYLIRPGYLIRVRGVQGRVDSLNPTARDGQTVFRIAAKDYDADRASASLELDTYPRNIAQAIARARTALGRARRA